MLTGCQRPSGFATTPAAKTLSETTQSPGFVNTESPRLVKRSGDPGMRPQRPPRVRGPLEERHRLRHQSIECGPFSRTRLAFRPRATAMESNKHTEVCEHSGARTKRPQRPREPPAEPPSLQTVAETKTARSREPGHRFAPEQRRWNPQTVYYQLGRVKRAANDACALQTPKPIQRRRPATAPAKLPVERRPVPS